MARCHFTVFLCLFASVITPGRAGAADFIVTNATDTTVVGQLNLRQAISQSNANGQSNRILFAPGVTTVNVSTALPVITSTGATTLIDGGGVVTLNGSPLLRRELPALGPRQATSRSATFELRVLEAAIPIEGLLHWTAPMGLS